jgi:dolichol kinase
VIPDIEVPLMWVFFPGVWDHLLLHSLLGVFTVCTLLAIIITRFIYPPVISLIFGVDRRKLDEACRVTPTLVVSCMLGALFHVLVDIPMHPFNPTLWPWMSPNEIVGGVVLFFGEGSLLVGFSRANMLFSAIMVVLGVLILLTNINKDLWEEIWLGNSSPVDDHDRIGTNHSSNEIWD